MTHAVIYTRFSPRRNEDDCLSCNMQEAVCRDHAEEQGWAVRSAHRDEGLSAKEDVHRPGLEAAIGELRRGDVLLVYRHDRLARSVLLAELVRRQVSAAGARIAAVEGDVAGEDESPEAVFVRQVLDAVAELERKLIGARTRSAMRQQQREGKRVSRFAPYGYRLDPSDETRLVPVEREQEAIKRAKELASSGLTAYAIAKALDQEMPDACRGKSWSVRTVAKILAR